MKMPEIGSFRGKMTTPHIVKPLGVDTNETHSRYRP